MVLDVFSRRLVGWMMGDTLRTELVLGALEMAIHRRDTAAGGGSAGPDQLIHHSDRGSQLRLNLSSQHLDREVCYGPRARLGRGRDRK